MASLRVDATSPAELPAYVTLTDGEHTNNSLTHGGKGDVWFIPYEESEGIYAFVKSNSVSLYKENHPEAHRYHGSVNSIRELYVFVPDDSVRGDYNLREDYTSLLLDFEFLTSMISNVQREPTELQIEFYFRQAGQLLDETFIEDNVQDVTGVPYATAPNPKTDIPSHVFYIDFQTPLESEYVKDSLNALDDSDNYKINDPTDPGEALRYYFNNDGFSGSQTLPPMQIPVLNQGLDWFTIEGKDDGSGYVDPDLEDVSGDSIGNQVAGVKDSFINLPSITANFDYSFTGDWISVKISNIGYNIDDKHSFFSDSKIYISEYQPNCASISFVGMYDEKNEHHDFWPVFWVRVDDSYAKAHSKEVIKHGYYYYRRDHIGNMINLNRINDDDDDSGSDPILYEPQWYDDLEYFNNIDYLQSFKDSTDNYVQDNYGGYDTPLSMPTILKWSRSDHTGTDYALNIFVHPKGVL